MKITSNNRTVDLHPDNPKEILFSISGGTDSASLLYLTCKHFPKMKIRPYNMLDINHPFDTECARDVLSWMRANFPNQQIEKLETYPFDDLDPDFEEEAKKIMKEKPGHYTALRGVVKILKCKIIHGELGVKYPGLRKVTGMSRNPSFEDMKNYSSNHLFDLREHRRDPEKETTIGTLNQPYINVDKKFVAGIFKENNLMDSLFKFTGSCVGGGDITNNFTEPCRECWWCHEKRWAFGTF